MVFNDPEIGRLQWMGQLPADVMVSERECLIATEVFAAEPNEPTEAFHRRMVATARAKGVMMISIGYEPPQEAPPNPAPAATGALH
jgi:hypothetical protein